MVRELGALLLDQVAHLDEQIAALEDELRERAGADEQAVRLMSIPGVGPLTAMTIQVFAPPMELDIIFAPVPQSTLGALCVRAGR